MNIWAHTLVKNEEKYLWYSVASVAPFVDKVLLWDTGSTDKTPEICKELINRFPEKIDFRQVKQEGADDFTLVRQEMLDQTDSDWFIILDGDEVWWEDSIKEVVDTINKKGNKAESFIVRMIYPIGDIYHRQEEAAGMYELAGKKGHVSLRAVNRRIPGLTSLRPHGTQGWIDENGVMIQDRDPKKIYFVDVPYMHFSLLPRGGNRKADEIVVKRPQKLKHELGVEFPKDFFYPEVFFRRRPKIIPSPWGKMSLPFKMRAAFETPLRKVKRKVWRSKVGY